MDLRTSASPCLEDQEEKPGGSIKTEVQKDRSMEIPELDSETVKNCIVVAGPIGKFGHGQSEHYDMAHFDEQGVKDLDCNIEKTGQRKSSIRDACSLLILIILAVELMNFLFMFFMPFPCSVFLATAIGLTGFFHFLLPQRFNSTRLIKWTLDEFSEEMKFKEYAFTSPAVQDKSGLWVLEFRQTADGENSFGLIPKHLGADIINVIANIHVSIRAAGLDGDLVPEFDPLKFVHKFECNGDCGFSPPIPINYEQLMGHKLEINCRICFTREELPQSTTGERVIYEVLNCIAKYVIAFIKYVHISDNIAGNGLIIPENKLESKMSTKLYTTTLNGTEPEVDFDNFMKDPETKTFAWKIPDFPARLKNVEWELSSPQSIVNSNGLCSIWRLQLIELESVFRLELQLRGLPRGISQIKIHHLIELVDNFGKCIPLKHYGSTGKNPDFMHLWDTRRVSLYPRAAILERFVDSERSLSIRISLHCKPNNTVKIFNESADDTDWILHN